MGKRYTKTAINWVRWFNSTLPVGELWKLGGIDPRREAELIHMGALLPTDSPELFTVAHIDVTTLKQK